MGGRGGRATGPDWPEVGPRPGDGIEDAAPGPRELCERALRARRRRRDRVGAGLGGRIAGFRLPATWQRREKRHKLQC